MMNHRDTEFTESKTPGILWVLCACLVKRIFSQ